MADSDGSKRRALPLYFNKRDDDLWEAIQRVPKGDRNHEIRAALRAHFLGEQTKAAAPVQPAAPEPPAEEDVMKDVNIGLGGGLIK